MYYVFKADGKDFEEMDWFEMLALYGYDAESKEIQKNDDDVNLLPRVVEKTLVPKFLCKASTLLAVLCVLALPAYLSVF
jgi:hypothetical protein